jgi:hypothetical protein
MLDSSIPQSEAQFKVPQGNGFDMMHQEQYTLGSVSQPYSIDHLSNPGYRGECDSWRGGCDGQSKDCADWGR